MFQQDSARPAGIARLISDLRTAKLELLSAQSATDRLRLQYSVAEIVSHGEPQALRGAIAAADALCRFYHAVAQQLRQGDDARE